jgi:hypothetical protein
MLIDFLYCQLELFTKKNSGLLCRVQFTDREINVETVILVQSNLIVYIYNLPTALRLP